MSKNVVINGVSYNNVPSVKIPLSGTSGDATFYETSDATATARNILATKTAYIDGGVVTGSMANNGSLVETIDTKAQVVSIPAGYYSGGSVRIRDVDVNTNIVSANIRSGRTILGVSGSSYVVNTQINSDAASAATILNGYKAYVNGSLVTGTATVPTVSQDSSTKVLSIS